MMRRAGLFFSLSLIFIHALFFHTKLIDGAEKFPVVWEISEGLKAPESAYLDEPSGLLFLSQIGEGGGAGKDGDGWISKLKTSLKTSG